MSRIIPLQEYIIHTFIKVKQLYNFVEQSYPVRDHTMHVMNTLVKSDAMNIRNEEYAMNNCPAVECNSMCLQYNQLWNYDLPVDSALVTIELADLNSMLINYHTSNKQKL